MVKQRLKRTSFTPFVLEEDVRIEGLSHDGRGIARHRGKTLFVDGALPDETVRVQVLEDKRRFMNARVSAVVDASAERCEPLCRHFKQCGGCSLQYNTHDAQLKNKQSIVIDQLQRFAKVCPESIDEPLRSAPYGYRHRSRLSMRWKKGQLLMGFREKGSNAICQISECPVLAEPLQNMPALLRTYLPTLKGREAISHAELFQLSDSRGVLLRHIRPLSETDRASLRVFAETHQLFIFLQSDADRIERLYPEDSSEFSMHYPLPSEQLVMHFRPQDFTQVNWQVNQAMVDQAIQWLQPAKTDRVLDLFCGIGNFSLAFARHGATVVGVEGSQRSVDQAKVNAKANDIENAEFFCADLSAAFDHQLWAKESYDIVLLDPPRAGADFMIDHLVGLLPERLLYISCNPATLARDAGSLSGHGYRLQRLSVMDMFPQTTHVESMALFVR